MNNINVSVPFSALSPAEQKRLIKAGIVKPPIDPLLAIKREWFYMCLESQEVSRIHMARLCNVTGATFNQYMTMQDKRLVLINRFYNATKPRQRDVIHARNLFHSVAKKAELTEVPNE